MPWYAVDLPVDEELPAHADRLTEEFDALFLWAGCPQGMALFAARASNDNVCFYFSPDAARYAHDIVEQFRGRSCAPPPRADLELVEGSAEPLLSWFSPRAALRRAAVLAAG